MLKTNAIYFFDLVEFEEIIVHYLDAGKHALAKKAVKLGLQQHPASVDLKLLQVEIYVFEDELVKAELLLKIIERLEPNNDEVFIQKATINSKKGKHKVAIELLKKALSFTDDKVDVWSLLGMEFLYLDNFRDARLTFQKCVKVDFEDYSALYNIVYCFDMEKLHEEAIEYLNDYIEINPYCEVAWHQLGRQYYILESYSKALEAFDYAVIIDESFIGGYLEKAKTLEQLEQYEDAIDNYLITLELDDATAFVCMRVGECYEKLGNFVKSYSLDETIDVSRDTIISIVYFDEDSIERFIELQVIPHTVKMLGVYSIALNIDRDDYQSTSINEDGSVRSYYRDMGIYEQLLLKHQENGAAMAEAQGISESINLLDFNNLVLVFLKAFDKFPLYSLVKSK